MSTRLDKKMAELKAAGKKGIFIYITAGAPDVETTLKAVREAENLIFFHLYSFICRFSLRLLSDSEDWADLLINQKYNK